jgi:predicted house-cleaning noncanonical NTP pyrophosphatase (MazG superfamily)
MFYKIKKSWRKFRLKTSSKTNFFVWMNAKFHGTSFSFWQQEEHHEKLANLMELKKPIIMANAQPPKLKEK